MLSERLLVSELGRTAFLAGASLVAEMVKNLAAMWKTQVWSLDWEDALRREMATHSSIKSKSWLVGCFFLARSSPQKPSYYLRYHPCFCYSPGFPQYSFLKNHTANGTQSETGVRPFSSLVKLTRIGIYIVLTHWRVCQAVSILLYFILKADLSW